MIAVLLVLAALVGFALGALTVFRLTPRIVARLDDRDRAAFARKVAATRHRR